VPGYRAPEDDDSPNYVQTGSGFLATLGIPLLSGREFNDSDGLEAPKVAVVNEAFARKYWGGLDVTGKQFGIGLGNVAIDITVVGVAANSGYSELIETNPRPVYYSPYRQQQTLSGYFFYVRTVPEDESIAGQIRRAVAALDPDLPVRGLRSMQASLNESMENRRILTGLSGIFAALATFLSAIGLYGVLAYSMALRTREIGIRMASGALPSDIRRMVAREAAWMFAAGAAVGLPLALAVGRLARSQLYGVTGQDPLVILGSVAALAAVAFFAVWGPARRAARVEPVRALRYE
jgi:predicted permease